MLQGLRVALLCVKLLAIRVSPLAWLATRSCAAAKCGWGAWIRTKIDRVRAERSTIKLRPSAPNYTETNLFCKQKPWTIWERHYTPPFYPCVFYCDLLYSVFEQPKEQSMKDYFTFSSKSAETQRGIVLLGRFCTHAQKLFHSEIHSPASAMPRRVFLMQ